MLKRQTNSNRGMMLIFVLLTLSAMIGFCSLAVDYGRVQVAKVQLRSAVDAAARYGTSGLSDGTAVTKATTAAASNIVDGSSLVLLPSDVETGTWSGSTFTPTSTSPNAVRVTTSRSRARNSAVSLTFARTLGVASCDISASAIAFIQQSPPGGIIGYDGITFKNNALIASYRSSVTTDPSASNCNTYGGLGSNAVIDGKNNNDLYGSAVLGPSGSISDIVVSRSIITRSSDIPTPSMPTWPASVPANPNNVPANYTTNGTTLPGGTYYFTSVTINGNVSFSGAATIYVNGNIDLNANLYAYNKIPSNLKIYQIGSRTFGDSKNNAIDIIAEVYAPDTDFTAKNNMMFRGRCFFKTITAKNNAELYYDESFGSAASSGAISTVK